MFCGKCGAQNEDGNTLCTACGESLVNETAEQPAPQQPEVQQPAPTAEAPVYSQPAPEAPAYSQPYSQPAAQPYAQQPYNQSNQPYNQQNIYVGTPAYDDTHMTMGDWLKRYAIMLIPCVGSLIYFIMLFVWAFGNEKKKSLKTYAQAQLIIAAIGIVFSIIIFAVAGAAIYSAFEGLSSGYAGYY